MQVNEITRVLRRFREECSLEHYGLPYECDCPVEEELRSILYDVQRLSAGELETIRESIDLHLAVLLNRFAQRMASAAVRIKSDDLVAVALMALSLDNDLLDDRELYQTGALIIDSLKRRGLDAESMFERYLAHATECRRALLMHQLKTAPGYMRSLKSMALGVIKSGTDFTYVDQLFESPFQIDEGLVKSAIEELLREEERGKEHP